MPWALRPSTVSSSSLSERPEPVEANDAQAVTGSGVIDEFGEAGAIEAFARDDVGEDANGAGLDETGALGVEVLVVGRDAGVAKGVAGAGRHGRINIVRFRDGFRGHAFLPVDGGRAVSLIVH